MNITKEAKVYAKEQQIKLIDSILFSLCSHELSPDGRKYLKKVKQKIAAELLQMRHWELRDVEQSFATQKI